MDRLIEHTGSACASSASAGPAPEERADGAPCASAGTADFAEAATPGGRAPVPSEAAPGLPAWEGRAILLVDLDAFFASVEQLDHPGWRGKPVIVGGDPDKRGVVSTASYEARRFGVHSAMPSSQAKRLCPDAIWTHGHFDRYRSVSNAIMGILRDETPLVQQVSIDEAFMDVTPTEVNREHPVAIAQRIQARVEALGVTCSVGAGTSKTVAKIASDMDKPRGLTVVFPGTERDFLSPLPVRALSGIGAAAEEKLRSRGILTLGDVAAAGEARLVRLFGKNGRTMFVRACGLDAGGVAEDDEVKSVSNETSFAEDLTQRADVEAAVAAMAAKVGRRLRRKGLEGRTLALRMRFGDRTVRSVQHRLEAPTADDLAFTPRLLRMIDEIWRPGIPVRLVGVAVTGFEEQPVVQERLFALDDGEGAPEAAEAPLDEERRRRLLAATDSLKDRFGEGAVRFGHELRSAANTTGSAAKNPADYK
ncbi:MAG TPA: DNA polymerase IV [Candidatus Aphodovivens avistercoris]|nr:DNA polymerase IV [Candidatus Aphodovivens avistercoris]